MAKTKRLTVTRAGRMVRAVLYTRPMTGDPPKVRAAKTKASSLAREKLNHKASWERCEELLAANFKASDLWITFTYRDADLPATREQAVRCLKNFLTQLRAARRARGEGTIYIKNVEHRTDEGKRWHHHVALNATGHDFEEIRALWSRYGDNIQIDPLLDGDNDFAARARYLCKERQPVGKQTWTPSRGLKRPVKTSDVVDDTLALAAPVGAVILDRDGGGNSWGYFEYIKYIIPDPYADFGEFGPPDRRPPASA